MIAIEIEEDTVTTVCGSFGHQNGNLREAQFSRITDIALDNHDIIVADDYRIRVVDTKQGLVNTITGKPSKQLSENADGTLQEARFSTVWALCVDAKGRIFVLDSLFSLRKIDREEGLVSTLLEKEKKPFGSFGSLCGMVLDKVRNVIYVGDSLYTKIYRLSLDSNGNLVAVHLVAQLSADSMALDMFGNLYVCNHQSQSISKIEADTGHISLVFQSPRLPVNQITEKEFPQHLYPNRLAVDSCGNILFTDSTWATVHQLDMQGNVSLVAGLPCSPRHRVTYKDGPALEAKFDTPSALALHEDDIFVVDSANNCIRKFTKSKKPRVTPRIRKWFVGLLQDQHLCDVEVRVTKDFTFKAHSIILFTRCPSFKKYLVDSSKNVCSLLDSEISELTKEAWMKFRDFIYTETIAVSDLSNTVLKDVIQLGQTLLLPRLVNLMDQYMQRNLTLDNCVEWLVIARNMELKCSTYAISLIQWNIENGGPSVRESLLGQIAATFSRSPNEKVLKDILVALFDREYTKFYQENLFGTVHVTKAESSVQETTLMDLVFSLHSTLKICQGDSDCTIEFPEVGLAFHCHKCILATRSEYFGGLFHGQFMESKQTTFKLKIKDILLWAFEDDAIKEGLSIIMDYLYLGHLSDVKADNYLLLIQLWKYFQLGNLDNGLQFWVTGSQLTKHNVQTMLETAKGLCLPELEAKCQRFLIKPAKPKRLDNNKLKQ